MGIQRVPAHWALLFYLVACYQWTHVMLTTSLYQQSASCSDGTTSDTTLCGHPVPVDSRPVRSLLDCASLCDGDPDCLGASYGNGADVNSPQLTSCVHYRTAPTRPNRSSPDSMFLKDPSWGTTLADVVDSTTSSGASTAGHYTMTVTQTMSSAHDDEESTTEATATTEATTTSVSAHTTAHPPFNGPVDRAIKKDTSSADETTTAAPTSEYTTAVPQFAETTTSPSVVTVTVAASSPGAFSTSDTSESPVRCQNGGILVTKTDTCNCVNRWTGENCERRAHNCAELITDLITLNNNNYFLETLSYQNGGYFDAYCQKNSFAYSLNIFRSTGITLGAFNKTWQEYKDGFFKSKGSFWIGLETLHKLTHQDSMNHHVWMEYMFSSSPTASIAWSFSDFKIGDESTGYQVTGLGDAKRVIRNNNYVPDGAEKGMGQCLDVTVGQQFSTYDHDNSASSSHNCAAAAGAGWWFTNCVDDCSPLGLSYVKNPSKEAEDHIRIQGLDLVNGGYKNKARDFRMALQVVR